MTPIGCSTAPFVTRLNAIDEEIFDGILDRVHQYARLVSHRLGRGLVEHLLELNRVLSDGDVSRSWEWCPLYGFPPPGRA